MYLTDVLDEYVMQQLTEYEDLKFANIAKEDVDTSAEAEGEVSHMGFSRVVNQRWRIGCTAVADVRWGFEL
jgi:HSP90 family molecular chaperone